MHSGFNSSWTKNNLNGRIIDRVLQIVRGRSSRHQHPDHPFRIMVSGERRRAFLSAAALWHVSATTPDYSLCCKGIIRGVSDKCHASGAKLVFPCMMPLAACASYEQLSSLTVPTGHSLGGALAQLAAHDVAVAAAEQNLDIRMGCYTYGSPRVGNHAFAREFDKIVPHCWHVINDQVCSLDSALQVHVAAS